MSKQKTSFIEDICETNPPIDTREKLKAVILIRILDDDGKVIMTFWRGDDMDV